MKKLIAALTALALTITSLPQVAYAATVVTFDISRGPINITDSTYSGYKPNGAPTSGSSAGVRFVITGTTTDYTVTVSGTQNITLSNCNIDATFADNDCAFDIRGSTSITLVGENTLKSDIGNAGLQKIGVGALVIQGTGSLTATGGAWGAGIGGCDGYYTSNITINGGTITATGGKCAAGIGGGDGSWGENITVNGGTVIATGGNLAAGIGGGYEYSGSNITINGGTVIATGGGFGAGIGGGGKGRGEDITISGGTVTATGGDRGAGIGSGWESSASNIVISGGSVKATGANTIGGGLGRDAVTPTDGNGNNVYLNTIPNPGSKPVYINGVSYTPVNHTAADPSDTNLYVYLSDTDPEITVGVSVSATLSNTSVNYGASAPTLSVTGTWSSLSYSSSNTSVATINVSGIITIKGAGTATFTVKAS